MSEEEIEKYDQTLDDLETLKSDLSNLRNKMYTIPEDDVEQREELRKRITQTHKKYCNLRDRGVPNFKTPKVCSNFSKIFTNFCLHFIEKTKGMFPKEEIFCWFLSINQNLSNLLGQKT